MCGGLKRMEKSLDSLTKLENALSSHGLLNMGCFTLQEEAIGLLVGNAGRQMWDHFCGSPEYSDGRVDPMNRWTSRVLGKIASFHDCAAVFPFDHPFPPFQQFATLATGTKSSPLGLLIHPEYGLWHAFRGVLCFDRGHLLYKRLENLIQDVEKMIHPCDLCTGKPCINACPVNAFGGNVLSVSACFDHLDSDKSPNCMEEGCAARNACPVGERYRYSSEQLAFHMKAYRGG